MKNAEYLDLLPNPLDSDQKKACFAKGNVIVAAGAGSGKTQVLATRFSYLVMSENISADKILTLTFTKKAAAEMYERIYKTLDFFSQNEKTPKLERERAQNALKIFSRAHIQTLDSYYAGILRQSAARFGITPDFVQDESNDNTAIENLVFSHLLENRNDFRIQNLVTIQNAANLQSIAKKIAEEIQDQANLASENDFFSQKHKKALIVAQKKCIFLKEKIFEYEKNLKKKLAENQENQENPKQFFAKDLLDFLCEIQNDLILTCSENSFENINFKNPQNPNDEKIVRAAKNILQKKFPSVKFPKNAFSDSFALNDANEKFSNAKENFESIKINLEIFFDAQNEKQIASLYDEILLKINAQKRRTGNLTFSDVSSLALKALLTFSDIRTQEQNSYDKIMIDEFQDNNGANRDLLFLISAKNETNVEDCLLGKNLSNDKLFFVGDEKQSIYKFRGADVSVFKKLELDLHSEPIALNINYRSNAALLDSFNRIFGGFKTNLAQNQNDFSKIEKIEDLSAFIFPRITDGEKLFEATYGEKNLATKNFSLKIEKNIDKYDFADFSKTPMHFRMAFKQKDCENSLEDFPSVAEQEAFFIAQEIRKKIDAAKMLGKKLCYSDFAILDRSRAIRPIFLRYLSLFGIPVELDQPSGIFDSPVTNDFYNFLRLCIFPSDSLALSVTLCSPFCDISISSMQSLLALGYNLENDRDEISFDFLSTNEQKKLQNFERNFFTLKNEILKKGVAPAIFTLWNDFGYKFLPLYDSSHKISEDFYDLLFEIARRCDCEGKNISHFLERLDSVKKKFAGFSDSEKDLAEIICPRESSDSVKILTIHKSKGLQFKIVFVSGCNGNPKSKNLDSSNLENFENPDLEKEMSAAEFRRIIYVALTRAKTEAYIVGSWNSKNSNSILNSIAKFYYPGCDDEENSEYEKVNFLEDAPFDFCKIPTLSREQMKTEIDFALKNSSCENHTNQKKSFLRFKNQTDFFKNVFPFYKDVAQNQKIISQKNQADKNIIIVPNKTEIEPPRDSVSLPFEKIIFGANDSEEFFQKLATKKFYKNDFGIISHAYLEATAKKEKNFFPPQKLWKDLWDFSKTTYENRQTNEIKKIDEICKRMVLEFTKSEIYAELLNAKIVKTEYAFLLKDEILQDGAIANGVIDLVFQKSDGTIFVIDYKTDEKIFPQIYFPQIALYARVARSLFSKPNKIRAFLFYLRYGKSVEIPAEKLFGKTNF